jgi:hypothetical protein
VLIVRNLLAAVLLLPLSASSDAAGQETVAWETPSLRFRLFPATGAYEILDKGTGVTWGSNPHARRFGEARLRVGQSTKNVSLGSCTAMRRGKGLEAAFRLLPDRPEALLKVRIEPDPDGESIGFACEVPKGIEIEHVRLLDEALWTTDAEGGCAVVPVREGLLVPARRGRNFRHRFDTFAYEGCHMQMFGIVKGGATALATWRDPYVAAELASRAGEGGRQFLSLSLVMRKSATSFRLSFPGKGDHVAIAKAYRKEAEAKGWRVTWKEKPLGRARLHGAVNFKLWSTLSRRMNEESTKEEWARVNYTFEQAVQIAEHLKRDLELEKVLFIMGGWIRRGYDNQHPDVLPAAPECGGSEGLADCARRVRRLGYLFCLHDNYQDMYRDAPSWDESYLMKRPGGELARGGRWAGGRAYLTCSKRALDLARRPENLPAVRKLTGADAYFIDTTYAAGLQECFDPAHPLTRADDLFWKLELSRYTRELFGIFGSECGREWAVPHSDFFEGLTGVSGRYFHGEGLRGKLGAFPVPLFEIVYRDCIALYGKYGYNPHAAAEYVLHHLVLGRPLHYHGIPQGLYWKVEGLSTAALHPPVVEVEPAGPRSFKILYRWSVERALKKDWRVFVHFTDEKGGIKFQNDHTPQPPTSSWSAGVMKQGPFTVRVPDRLQGTFDIRVGLWNPDGGARARLQGGDDGERRYTVGQIVVAGDRIEFRPSAVRSGPRRDLFVRAEGGWAEGMNPWDRFIKNTYEILSPLHALTAETPLADHDFLTPDRKVQRSVFGAVRVIVNAGAEDYRVTSKSGGEVLLPPYGFLVDAPTFTAFHARSWGGLAYDDPPLFTLRSLDGEPLSRSRRIRIFHAFGEDRVRIGEKTHRVAREAIVTPDP